MNANIPRITFFVHISLVVMSPYRHFVPCIVPEPYLMWRNPAFITIAISNILPFSVSSRLPFRITPPVSLPFNSFLPSLFNLSFHFVSWVQAVIIHNHASKFLGHKRCQYYWIKRKFICVHEFPEWRCPPVNPLCQGIFSVFVTRDPPNIC